MAEQFSRLSLINIPKPGLGDEKDPKMDSSIVLRWNAVATGEIGWNTQIFFFSTAVAVAIHDVRTTAKWRVTDDFFGANRFVPTGTTHHAIDVQLLFIFHSIFYLPLSYETSPIKIWRFDSVIDAIINFNWKIGNKNFFCWESCGLHRLDLFDCIFEKDVVVFYR